MVLLEDLDKEVYPLKTSSIVVGSNNSFRGAPLSAPVETSEGIKSVVLLDVSSGGEKPGQIGEIDGQPHIVWIEDPMKPGDVRRYVVDYDRTLVGGVAITTVEDRRLDVTINGKLFMSYNYGPDSFRPYLHPVIGPHGIPITRGFPMIANVPGESTDHPHHRGIWSAYGEVGGVDNWAETDRSGRTVHRCFAELQAGPVFGRIIAVGDWVDSKASKIVLAERRDIKIYDSKYGRFFDVVLTLTAKDSDVLFGDTKEGGFISVRVASSMDVTRGGRLENARGGIGEPEVWGKRAEWCDYSGPLGGRIAGIAVLEHPSSFKHPTYWHARDYGLMSANPFGISAFLGGNHNGDYVLRAGESIDFSYRVYIHEGGASEGEVSSMYHAFVDPPTIESS